MSWNQPPVEVLTIDWLKEKKEIRLINEPESIYRTDAPIPAEIGKGWVEFQNLSLGTSLCQGSFTFTPKASGQFISLPMERGNLDGPILTILSVRKGQVAIRSADVNQEYWLDNNIQAFTYRQFLDCTLRLNTNEAVELASIKISQSFLYRFFGEEETHRLLRALNIEKISSIQCMATPVYISEILHGNIHKPIVDDMGKYYVQVKILEYLTLLAQYLSSLKSNNESSSHKARILKEIHDELVEFDGKIPTLDELSKRYGMSGRVLNNKFKNRYGESIWSFMNNQRLYRAHKAIQSSDIALKALSAQLGYSYVNHFITAFKRKFGYTPGNLRRQVSGRIHIPHSKVQVDGHFANGSANQIKSDFQFSD
ncbi:helix-turn-helix domain-containing protein [Emcibacter nanhaiensis]|uniref:Helix-turn-helix transcriptional regulator n=1 Tax=Emcibacter nanhaiensis TaxID=1505037 RepID=A0A501PGE4_9PROT|nr:AraC family transcriptional regulator [Emcibacter nanhaiensis]TPD59530.1 helix-turn-helix transcriptional regulator [Emcibacter nanhaiensis]